MAEERPVLGQHDCQNCGMEREVKPMIFKYDPWCSDQCRKALEAAAVLDSEPDVYDLLADGQVIASFTETPAPLGERDGMWVAVKNEDCHVYHFLQHEGETWKLSDTSGWHLHYEPAPPAPPSRPPVAP